MSNTIRPFEYKDFSAIHDIKLKAEDIRELEALHPGYSMASVILESIQNSLEVSVIENAKGEIWCIFGVGEGAGGVYLPWMLSTDEINANPRFTMKEARAWLTSVQEKHAMLGNIVSVENAKSLRFLEALGFKFLDKEVHTINGVDFILFYWNREGVTLV